MNTMFGVLDTDLRRFWGLRGCMGVVVGKLGGGTPDRSPRSPRALSLSVSNTYISRSWGQHLLCSLDNKLSASKHTIGGV